MVGFITAASLLCVIGTALTGVTQDPSAGLGGDAFFATLSREPRHTPNGVDCGIRGPSYQTLIAGGEDASVGEFPWHVGVYRTVVNKPSVQDCGGTLISRTLVLTAAHCFWDEAQSKLKPNGIFKIAAGKHLRAWDSEEQETQFRDVAEISVPRRYQGRFSNHQHDIAVVRLSSGVDFTASVLPACMDWTKRYEAVQLSVGVLGTAVGWGVTHDNVASEVLQKVDLPFVDFDTCFDALDKNVKKFYTEDKFCVGFANNNRSVCTGDSGGGLTFETGDRNYLRGVASISFKPEFNRDPCYSQLYTGFTLVSHYLPWIKTFVDNETEGSGVRTPKPPKKSISQEMCKLYSTAVYETVDIPLSQPVKVSTCAMSPPGVSSHRLISQPREFPHMAALAYVDKTRNSISYLCNGNLISEQFVLTTAHCVVRQREKYKLSFVVLGTVNIKEKNKEPGVKIVGVERMYLHSEYKIRYAYNDLALVKLNETVTFNGFVRPACLDPSPSLLDQETLTAASWGRVAFGEGVYESLFHGDVNVVRHNECRQIYDNQTIRNSSVAKGVTTNITCFNTIDSGIDCSLTSGSPLMVKLTDPFCMYRIVGIVSFGPPGRCSGKKLIVPNVGMRISAFTPWIESIVWPTPIDAVADKTDDAETAASPEWSKEWWPTRYSPNRANLTEHREIYDLDK